MPLKVIPSSTPLWRVRILLAFLVSSSSALRLAAQSVPEVIPYGGHHEFTISSGDAPHDGHVFGYDRNTRYSPTVLRYSYLFYTAPLFQVRYAPEITALAVLHENAPSSTNPAAPVTHLGAGVSPVNFQMIFLRRHRVQPFINSVGGALYFADRVLSPQGSQFMYTVGPGGGVNLFTSRRNALVVGFVYDHLSNANISQHNPGTDEEIFYLGFSHFHTRGVR